MVNSGKAYHQISSYHHHDMINAGRMGQRLYMGDGCCGIGALYDQEAGDLLSLNEDSFLMYLVAVGQIKK